MDDIKTLGTELPKEIARVRDEVLPRYAEIGAPGLFAVTMMKADMDAAARAMAEGSMIEMFRIYKSLLAWKA